MRLSTLSTEYVRVPVSVSPSADPTADTVAFAFLTTTANPVSGDWKTGDWETVSGVYYARIIVGPAQTVVLTAGEYNVWLKVTDSPEIPVRKIGVVVVT